MQEHRTKYKEAVCRGSLMLGTGCRTCEKCQEELAILRGAGKSTKQEDRAEHVAAGEPDGRQSAATITPSRFRSQYRPLTHAEKALHDEIKMKAAEQEGLFELVKPGRYRSLGITDLESSVMWVKELTS